MIRATWFSAGFLLLNVVVASRAIAAGPELPDDLAQSGRYRLYHPNVGPHDWPQWGGSSLRNNSPVDQGVPLDWDVSSGRNVLWSVPLGSVIYSTPVVANGQVYIGTNNQRGYVKRFPREIDVGCFLCLDATTGEFLWQHTSRKLPTGRVHDWPEQGIVSSPLVDGDRLWYVTSRGEVACLDTDGFRDQENDGPFQLEEVVAADEADVVWLFDMMRVLGVSQHNMCTCSPTTDGKRLFVVTGNGVDESHINIPAPEAPAFLCLDLETGRVLWTDNSPGKNILHGSWSSPSYAVLGGVPQVLMPGGDGWLYSFAPEGDSNGGSRLLWKFDGNPKGTKHLLGGRGTRNEFLTAAVVYHERVYFAMGQDADNGEGESQFWCIDPTVAFDGSDVSAELVLDGQGNVAAPRRLAGFDPQAGERVVPNPKSAVVWKYDGQDSNRDGKREFEEEFHRTCATPTIRDGLVYVSDFSGLLHCLDANTGTAHWIHDLFSCTWVCVPLVIDGHVFVPDEDGDMAIFKHAPKLEVVRELSMENACYSMPIAANGILYVANRNTLFAIGEKPE